MFESVASQRFQTFPWFGFERNALLRMGGALRRPSLPSDCSYNTKIVRRSPPPSAPMPQVLI